MRQAGLGQWIKRIVLALLLLLAMVGLGLWFFLRGSLAQLDGRRSAPGLSGTASVVRDGQGVPTISGSDRKDVAYATGFVHAQDRYFQMDLLRRVASGELAELFGARALPMDREHRLHRFRARAEAALQAMPAADRQLLERYVAGVNDGLNNLGTRPFEYALIRVSPRPWSAADSLLVFWAMYFDLQGNLEGRELARGWLREHATPEQLAVLLPESTQWDVPLDVPANLATDQAASRANHLPTNLPQAAAAAPAPGAPFPDQAPAWWGKSASPEGAASGRVAALDGRDGAQWHGMVGSNNWAVAGSRSQGGGAIVADDMHLGIQLPHIWYRAVLMVPDGHGATRRVAGVTLPGVPLVVVGSNGHVAWGFTNSYGDYADLVTLETDPAHPGKLRTPAGWETPVAHQESILVKDAASETFVVRETSLGPVREVAGRSYALHWVAHARGAVNFVAAGLETASTVDDALAVANRSGLPAQNFVAGDSKGNIGWTIAGPLPRRAQPGLASTFPLAGETQAAGWNGLLSPDAYPAVRNPADGQLSTANSRQLMGAGHGKLGDGGFDLGARAHQVRGAVAALGAKTDEQGVYSVALDDRALFMAGWRDRALAALDDQAVAAGDARGAQRAAARELLRKSWSGHASVESVGYRISRSFMWSLYELLYGGASAEMGKLAGKADMAAASSRWPVVVARLLDEQPAGWLPPQYASWKELQLAAIDHAVAELTRDGKPLAGATWGERNRQEIAHPIASAAPALRRWLTAPADPLPGDSHMPRVAGRKFGQSERMVVSPGKEEQGIFNMPGGQSGHPLSPFFLAGHADWVSGKPTPFLPGAARHTLTFVKP
ncbi:penicillin amidase [Massilia sp. Root351]|uniref:penicillin acylase family protein n=1 Tax=Massilia sp. Root351 TaxID=1736522 RepID=UPI00070F7E24|nr:penicillin acylase family protein [Massilia sp. Root351]KQV87197.1 penicillin amidase [Massilia sp. Root351]